VKELVEAHGGNVVAEGGPGGIGATITLRLPLAMASPAEDRDL
jgi:signal transduction histidine kinase